MSTRKIAGAVTRLARNVAERYAEHAKEREEKLDRIETRGVFGAAGMVAAVRRTAHMSLAEGRALIAAPAATAPPPSARPAKALEAIVGGLDDSDHVNFLARGIRAARTVCRLTLDGEPVGTGFLVAPGLILTNNHVIGSSAEARQFVAEFDYELDVEDQPRRPVVRFELDPDAAFVTSSADELDFTFVAVRPTSVDGRERVTTFGWLPMDPRTDKILEGEPIVIIQHPRGDPKRVCLFAAELVDRLEDFIHYTTDTDGGASGSPALNRGWLLVGLHHAATTTDRVRRGHRIVVNEGVRISRIVDALRTGNRIADGAEGQDARAKVLAAVTRPDVVADGRPQSPVIDAAIAGATGRATPVDGRTPPIGLERTVIKRPPADHFDRRPQTGQGYRPGFLGAGTNVPLPKLPAAMQDDAARVGGSPTRIELRYTHYSTVHSVSRRLPLLTACNIDGARSQRLGRKDRDFEAADKWSFDPRIDEDMQLGPHVYDGTPFDFGHMVRREDPVWSDDDDLNTAPRMANDDTFYMTNCAPQHSSLNQRTWLRLEDAVLNSARSGRVRISVFTGPVLSPQDPTVRGVQVPVAFWKVVAYRANGRLRAHGFMQWQDDLVADMGDRFEALAPLSAAAEYQVPIADIARDTALDFGPLVAADEDLAANPERIAPAGTMRRERRRLSDRLVDALAERLAGADEAKSSAADDAGSADAGLGAAVTAEPDRVASRLSEYGNGGTGGEPVDARMLLDVLGEIRQLLRELRAERIDG